MKEHIILDTDEMIDGVVDYIKKHKLNRKVNAYGSCYVELTYNNYEKVWTVTLTGEAK